MFTNHICDKGFVSRIYKESLRQKERLANRKKESMNKKFTKEEKQVAKNHFKNS